VNNPILQVLNSTPINRQARYVTSQTGCVEFDVDLTRVEIIELLTRLSRKLRLLKLVLQVGNARQHKNLIARHKMGLRSNYRPKRAIEEYMRIGRAMCILNQRLAEIKVKEGREARQILGALENAWRVEHPGCIWDGRRLVAPNGAVFQRAAVAQQLAEVA
jgi:hypothetical protein